MKDKDFDLATAERVQQLLKFNEQLTALHWIAAQIATEQDLNTLYNLINNGFEEIIGIANCGFYAVDQKYNLTELASNAQHLHCVGATVAIRDALKNRQQTILLHRDYCGYCEDESFCSQVTLLINALHDRSGKVKGVLVAYAPTDTVVKHDYFKILELYTLHVSLALENASLTEQLKTLANTDGLTNLYNNRYFATCLAKQIEDCEKNDDFFSLLLMDVDSFKLYNDRFGHLAGDYVLQKVGETIKALVGNQGMVFRYGGEEFTTILPGYNFADAFNMAEKIRQAIAAIKFNNSSITVSIGLAQFPTHAQSGDELFEHADQGLYNAKAAGKNKVCLPV